MTAATETRFRGVVGGVEYDDPGLFETAARALGYRRGQSRGTNWKAGTLIAVRLEDGTKVEGQVWSRSAVANYVWVALDNGRYAAVHQHTGSAFWSVGYEPSGRVERGRQIGKVAA